MYSCIWKSVHNWLVANHSLDLYSFSGPDHLRRALVSDIQFSKPSSSLNCLFLGNLRQIKRKCLFQHWCPRNIKSNRESVILVKFRKFFFTFPSLYVIVEVENITKSANLQKHITSNESVIIFNDTEILILNLERNLKVLIAHAPRTVSRLRLIFFFKKLC